MAYNHPLPGQTSRRATMRRIGTVLLGIGIGCVILGFFHVAKQNAMRKAPPAQQPSGQSPSGQAPPANTPQP